MKAYLPFNGQTIYGVGEVKKSDKKGFRQMFVSPAGNIYFNKYSDYQVRDMYKMIKP